MLKHILSTYTAPRGHWVGDGFPVRSLFSYDRQGASNISPFLLLDYAGPADFAPTDRRRGVGQHPHRGFETVTLVYRGELEHRDSTGSGGLIGEGDVQWMTAGAGIVHEEFHSPAFSNAGGSLEMVQLWVNLPARHKDAKAAYQTLRNADIPRVPLDNTESQVRVIAGDFRGHEGPARTFTPINVWDLDLLPGSELSLPVPDGHTTLLVVLSGTVMMNRSDVLREAELASFSRRGDELHLASNNCARLLLLSGEPIDEPVIGHGPFVMNTEAQIQQAVLDFQKGRFGTLNRQ